MKLSDLKTSRLTLTADAIPVDGCFKSWLISKVKNPTVSGPAIAGGFICAATVVTGGTFIGGVLMGGAIGFFSRGTAVSNVNVQKSSLNRKIDRLNLPYKNSDILYVEKKPKTKGARNSVDFKALANHLLKDNAETVGCLFVFGTICTLAANKFLGAPFKEIVPLFVGACAPTIAHTVRSIRMSRNILNDKWIMGRLPSYGINRLYGNRMNAQPK